MEVLQRLQQQQQPADSYDGSSSSDAGSSSDGGDSEASLEEGPAGQLDSIPPALTRLLKRVSRHGKAQTLHPLHLICISSCSLFHLPAQDAAPVAPVPLLFA